MRQSFGQIATILAVVGALLAPLACGRLKQAADKAMGKDHKDDDGDSGTPGPTEPITVDADVDAWADDAIARLALPAAGGESAKPYGSCGEYYESLLGYAKALQAMHLKRYVAWARYQLAVGGFTTIAGQPYPGDVGASGGDWSGEKEGMGAPETADTAASDGPVSSPSGGASPTAPGAVASEYETNNQEKGVDETDYVKSNGRYIFVASGNLLRVVDLNGTVVHAAQVVNERPRGLHLSGDRLVLVTESSFANPYLAPDFGVPYGHPDYWWGYWGYWRQRVWYYSQLTHVHEFRIGVDGTLTPVKDRRYFGAFRDGREIDGSLHLVMQKSLPWHILATGFNLALHPAYALIHNEPALIAYAQRIAEENLNAWRRYMFEEGDLMAEHRDSYKAGRCGAFTRLTSTTAERIEGAQLAQLYRHWDAYVVYRAGMPATVYAAYPIFPAYEHVTTVATIDLDGQVGDSAGQALSPVRADMVYASTDKLLVGNTRYQWHNYWRQIYVLPVVPGVVANCLGDAELCAKWDSAPLGGVVPVQVVPVQTITTTTNHFDFLTFDLSDQGAVPTGIGTLAGTPVNNYAIDAGPTTLRFIVTENNQTTAVGGGVVVVDARGAVNPLNQWSNASKLKVMRLAGADWQEVASLSLDIGGSVSGARFIGSAAFVSTGNAADPLYAVSLADESNPTLAGAMPDAMRSTYFHAMDDGKTILALGRKDPGQVVGGSYSGYALTVAMIDVANLAAPAVLATAEFLVGGSSAEYDFKSFRFIPRLGVLVVPMAWPFRLELLAASRDLGFAHFGTVTLQDKLTQTYGISGNARTMLFDDLLVGVFGNQDVGVDLGYAARAPSLLYGKSLQMLYQIRKVDGWPYYWYLEGAHEIAPRWRSATLLQ